MFRSASAVNVMIYGIIRGWFRIGSQCDDLLHYPRAGPHHPCEGPHRQSCDDILHYPCAGPLRQSM